MFSTTMPHPAVSGWHIHQIPQHPPSALATGDGRHSERCQSLAFPGNYLWCSSCIPLQHNVPLQTRQVNVCHVILSELLISFLGCQWKHLGRASPPKRKPINKPTSHLFVRSVPGNVFWHSTSLGPPAGNGEWLKKQLLPSLTTTTRRATSYQTV